MMQQMGPPRGGPRGAGVLRKVAFGNAAEPAADSKLVSLVVTINSGSSYDALFTSVPQKVGEGERAATYVASSVDMAALHQLVEMGSAAPICQTQPDAASLVADLAAIEPASVVFNWECCSGCTGDRFCLGPTSPVPLMAFLLSRGYMVMCSDFSLGALIKEWDSELLGANPFVKVGELSSSMALRFDAEALKACDDSAQLQVLGELCANGEASVHAMGGTKAYSVDPSVRPVNILTVVSALDGRSAQDFVGDRTHLLSEVGQHIGLAGHVVVPFEGGGRLLTSCPHWIELSKLDAEEAAVLAVAEERYGSTYSNELRQQFEAMGNDAEGQRQRKAFSSVQACQFVQQSSAAKWVPSKRSK